MTQDVHDFLERSLEAGANTGESVQDQMHRWSEIDPEMPSPFERELRSELVSAATRRNKQLFVRIRRCLRRWVT